MQSIKQIERLNQRELDAAVPASASWHTDYRDTAYIYIGGLSFELSEGDVVTLFSQFGEPVWVRLARDKETGKSRGFAWLKYEDQRSCDLAVDNLSGANVMGKLLAVDHTRYQKRENEDETEGYVGQDRQIDAKDSHRSKTRPSMDPATESDDEQDDRPMIKEEIELAKLLKDHDDDDPMKAYMVQQKKDEVEEALKGVSKSGSKEKKHRRHHHKSNREDRDRDYRSQRSTSVDDRDSRRHRHRSRRHSSPSPRRDRTARERPSTRRSPGRDSGRSRSPRPRR